MSSKSLKITRYQLIYWTFLLGHKLWQAKSKKIRVVQQISGSQSYQTFFISERIKFTIFAIRLGYFITNPLASYVTNTQAYHRVSEIKEKESLAGLTPGVTL